MELAMACKTCNAILRLIGESDALELLGIILLIHMSRVRVLVWHHHVVALGSYLQTILLWT